MHVHGAHLNPNAYAAVEAEKTAARKRAAEVRKKLLAGASEAEGEAELQPIPAADEGNEGDSPPGDQTSKENPAEENDPPKRDAPGSEDAGEQGESPDSMSIWG